MSNEGQIYRISGPVVTAKGMSAAMYDVVRVGEEGLMGEVIEIHGDQSVIQVYEDPSGIRPGEPVLNTTPKSNRAAAHKRHESDGNGNRGTK